ncbi:MAG: flagellar hook-length control protein FliK [Armatimonadota bacterium]|nr:flagellar hook-length control protein FliK [bacterium]MDW8320249.1 flagellar hook-length control protein FliK [Armatimonadota bacterium]
MTQTVQVEASTSALPTASRFPPQGAVSDTQEDSRAFAQLLEMAQALFFSGEQKQETPVLADGLLSAQQSPNPVEEAEQLAAFFGVPLLVANVPSVQPAPIDTAPTSEDGTSRQPVQIAFLPQVATDMRAPMHPRVVAAQAQAMGFPNDATISPLSADVERQHSPDVPVAASPTADVAQPVAEMSANRILTDSKQADSAPSADQVQTTPDASGLGPTTAPAPEVGLTQGATGKAHKPPEVLSPVTGTHNPTAAFTQAADAAQTQRGGRHESQNVVWAIEDVQMQVNKQTDSEKTEKPSVVPSPEARLHGTQGVESVSVTSRHQQATAQMPEVSPADVVRQVTRQLESMVGNHNTGSVTLQLEPEHLGKLRVTISLSHGTIHTHIVADNHAVRQMLESNSSLLQQALQERGLQLGALQVSVQGDSRQFLFHQPYTLSPAMRGWLQAEAAIHTTSETGFVRSAPGGINLLA